MKTFNLPEGIDTLDSSELSKLLVVNLKPSLERAAKDTEWIEDKNTGALRPKKRPKLSPEESYSWSSLQHLANIINAFRRLEHARIFINRFPQPRKYEKVGITEDKWIYYHYSFFLTTVVSIYDTAILLVNAIFKLGLNPRECNNNTVVENEHVNKTATYQRMKSLEKIIAPYRPLRNKYVHRNETPRLDYLQFNEIFSALQRDGETKVNVKHIDKLYKISRSMLIEELDEMLAPLLDAVLELFNALHPEYQLRSSFYKRTDELEQALNSTTKTKN
jgi:hypothetical protein